MRKILAVVRREFVERVRTKWFWIGTVLGPLFFGGMILVRLLNGEHSGVERRVAVIDQTTGGTGARLVDGLSASLERFHFVRVPSSSRAVDSLTNVVIAKDLDGFLLVSDSTLDDGSVEYRGSNVSSLADMEELRSTLGRQVFAVRLERHGIDPAVVRDAELTVAMATHKIRGTKVTGESGEQAFTLSFAMAIILFLAIVLYGVNVMSSVLEEKTTRIVEVLVSSLRPFQLMLGKVLGAGAVGIGVAAGARRDHGRVRRLLPAGLFPLRGRVRRRRCHLRKRAGGAAGADAGDAVADGPIPVGVRDPQRPQQHIGAVVHLRPLLVSGGRTGSLVGSPDPPGRARHLDPDLAAVSPARDLGRGSDLPGRHPDDGEASQRAGNHPLGPRGLAYRRRGPSDAERVRHGAVPPRERRSLFELVIERTPVADPLEGC